MGTDSTSTPSTTERDLLLAKVNYHQAKHELLSKQVDLYDAKAALATATSDGVDSTKQQQSVHACEDIVTLAEAKVTVASAAIERLLVEQWDRRQTVAEHIRNLLFRPGAGLVDIVFFDDDIDAGDPLGPRSVFDGMFGDMSPKNFDRMFGGRTPQNRESLFESGRKLFGDAASRVFGAWDDIDASRAADAESNPDAGNTDKGQAPTS